MEEIEKGYSEIEKNNINTEGFSIICSKEIYESFTDREYKGLKIHTSALIPKGSVYIGKIFM